MRTCIGVVALSLAYSSRAFAQGQPDAAAVCAVAEKHYAAIRAGDSNTILQQHMPDHYVLPWRWSAPLGVSLHTAATN